MVLCGVFYACLGLFFLYKNLVRHFAPRIAFLTCFATIGGTNLYYYTIAEMAMSHVYSFCLFAAFIFYVPRLYKENKLINYIVLSVLLGLIVLIRPTNIIIALYLAGYGVLRMDDAVNRIRFFLVNWQKTLLFPLVGFCWTGIVPRY